MDFDNQAFEKEGEVSGLVAQLSREDEAQIDGLLREGEDDVVDAKGGGLFGCCGGGAESEEVTPGDAPLSRQVTAHILEDAQQHWDSSNLPAKISTAKSMTGEGGIVGEETVDQLEPEQTGGGGLFSCCCGGGGKVPEFVVERDEEGNVVEPKPVEEVPLSEEQSEVKPQEQPPMEPAQIAQETEEKLPTTEQGGWCSCCGGGAEGEIKVEDLAAEPQAIAEGEAPGEIALESTIRAIPTAELGQAVVEAEVTRVPEPEIVKEERPAFLPGAQDVESETKPAFLVTKPAVPVLPTVVASPRSEEAQQAKKSPRLGDGSTSPHPLESMMSPREAAKLCGTVGCYMIFDRPARGYFTGVWSDEPVEDAIAFFSPLDLKAVAEKIEAKERQPLTMERGTHKKVLKSSMISFAKLSTKHEGIFCVFASRKWTSEGLGSLEIVWLATDNKLYFCKKGGEMFDTSKAVAVAAVDNSFRLQGGRSKQRAAPSWTKSAFATTARSIAGSAYADLDPASRRI